MNPIANLHRDLEVALDNIEVYAGGKKYHLAKRIAVAGSDSTAVYLTYCGKTGTKIRGNAAAKGLTPCKTCHSCP